MTVKNNQFGPTYPGNYPEELRTQLWPLCCGARILSGLQHTQLLSEEELTKQIEDIIKNKVPDHQVYAGERMMPELTFLTLNKGQMSSPKIMNAIQKAGFVLFAKGKPRGSDQGFFVRDDSNTFQVITSHDTVEKVA